jgi:hypothetical protein
MPFECDDLLPPILLDKVIWCSLMCRSRAFCGFAFVLPLPYASAEYLDYLQRFHRVRLAVKPFEDLLHNLPV